MNIKYYRTFISYKVPFEPQGELLFRETEGLNSFYVGYHDERDRLVQFVKLLLQEDGTADITWSDSRKPGETVYFEAKRNFTTGRLEPGAEISYEATETSAEYLCGMVTASTAGPLTLIRKQQALRDFYLYEKGKKLGLRVLLRPESQMSVWTYDAKGNPRQIDGLWKALAPFLENTSTQSVQVEISGRETVSATEELLKELRSEAIPQQALRAEIAPTGEGGRVGLLLVPVLAPLLIEMLYRWLVAHDERGLSIALRVGNRRIDASATHFDRKEYIEFLSATMPSK